MRMRARAEIELSEPDADTGLVTWWTFDVVDSADDDPEVVVGTGRAASIHVGEAANVGVPLRDVLDADGAELEALHERYFDGDWLKEEFADGSGSGVIYVTDLEILPSWRDRGIELAVVRRLCDTLGQGAALAVIMAPEADQVLSWIQMGFEVTPRAAQGRWEYLHLRLGLRTPRVIEEAGRFRAAPGSKPLAPGSVDG